MARLSTLICISALATSSAFTPKSVTRTPSKLNENFGFSFAEDQAENTPDIILGEANYKQWVGENIDNSFLNRQVSSCGSSSSYLCRDVKRRFIYDLSHFVNGATLLKIH